MGVFKSRKPKGERFDFDMVSDEELAGLPTDEWQTRFLRSEAEGAGDYEMLDKGPIVAAYDVAGPNFPAGAIRAVEEHLHPVTTNEIASLSADLRLSPQDQRTALAEQSARISEGLHGLGLF